MDLIYKILANKYRREIIKLLQFREMTVWELQQKLNMPQPLTSTHLAILYKAGLVDFIQVGKQRYYKLNPDTLGILYNSFYELFSRGIGYSVRIKK